MDTVIGNFPFGDLNTHFFNLFLKQNLLNNVFPHFILQSLHVRIGQFTAGALPLVFVRVLQHLVVFFYRNLVTINFAYNIVSPGGPSGNISTPFKHHQRQKCHNQQIKKELTHFSEFGHHKARISFCLNSNKEHIKAGKFNRPYAENQTK